MIGEISKSSAHGFILRRNSRSLEPLIILRDILLRIRWSDRNREFATVIESHRQGAGHAGISGLRRHPACRTRQFFFHEWWRQTRIKASRAIPLTTRPGCRILVSPSCPRTQKPGNTQAHQPSEKSKLRRCRISSSLCIGSLTLPAISWRSCSRNSRRKRITPTLSKETARPSRDAVSS